MERAGSIFNIQHFSVNDGPGIRIVVFLKAVPWIAGGVIIPKANP